MASRFDDHALNSRLTLNNLGGMGPSSGSSTNKYRDMPWIVYEGIMVLDGRSVDLIISDVSGGNKYYMDNIQEEYLVRKSRAVDNYKTNGTAFVLKYNGKFRPDVISIGSLATGEYNFKFSFVDPEQSNLGGQVPVTVPYLPMTFFDLDGKTTSLGESFEVASTWDAEGVEYVQGTKVDHGCKQIPGDKHFCYANSAREEIKIPDNFNELSDDTKKAAATFLFKDKSHFTINYKLNYPHRVFLFKGSCALTTTATTTTTTATTTTTTTTSTGSHQVGVDGDGDTDVNKYCGGSMASRFDDHALNSRLTLNNLGGMGPSSGSSTNKYRDMPWIVYEGIMVLDGRSVDLIISDVSGGNKYYMDNIQEEYLVRKSRAVDNYKTNGTAFVLKYNGKFRPDVISIGSLATGEYNFKFSFVDSKQSNLGGQVPVTIPYLPMTFFDLDGTDDLSEPYTEVASTWDAEGVEYVHGTKVDHGCKQIP